MALVVGDVRHLRLILGLDIVDIGLVRWRWVVFFCGFLFEDSGVNESIEFRILLRGAS